MKKKLLNSIYQKLLTIDELRKDMPSMNIIRYYKEIKEKLLVKNNISLFFWENYQISFDHNLKLINFDACEGLDYFGKEDYFDHYAIDIFEHIKRFGIKKFTISGPEANVEVITKKLVKLGCRVRGTETIKIYRRKITAIKIERI